MAKTGTTIYVRADGSVEGTERIQKNGNVYTFLDDINGSLIVEKDNVVINGAGYSLRGEGVLDLTGITLLRRRNVSIRNITLTGFGNGVFLDGSENVSIFGNTIIYNDCGICLDSLSNNNNLYENHVAMNNRFGIYLFNSSNNTIVENIIEKNAEFGIILIYSSNNNMIYHNSFINNFVQVFASDSVDFWDVTPPPDSVNIWDNGYPSGGNYWQEYVHVDNYESFNQNQTGSDGIWDYPYVIDPLNQDNYPLVAAVIIPEFPSWIIIPLFLSITLFVIVFKKKLLRSNPQEAI